jgi:hypothetical protein
LRIAFCKNVVLRSITHWQAFIGCRAIQRPGASSLGDVPTQECLFFSSCATSPMKRSNWHAAAGPWCSHSRDRASGTDDHNMSPLSCALSTRVYSHCSHVACHCPHVHAQTRRPNRIRSTIRHSIVPRIRNPHPRHQLPRGSTSPRSRWQPEGLCVSLLLLCHRVYSRLQKCTLRGTPYGRHVLVI